MRKSETISQPGNKELPSDSDNCSSSNKARISKPADETEVLNWELASGSTELENKSSSETNTTRDGDMEVLNLKVPSPSSNCQLVVSTQRRKSSRRSNRRRSSSQRSNRRRSSSWRSNRRHSSSQRSRSSPAHYMRMTDLPKDLQEASRVMIFSFDYTLYTVHTLLIIFFMFSVKFFGSLKGYRLTIS